MTLELPDLPYAHDALAALGMARETLEYHHDLHHKAYVDNGNKLIAGSEWENKPIAEIVAKTYQPNQNVQSGIFNNVAQHWNHIEFWQSMTPHTTPIPQELSNRLSDAFGSLDAFKQAFIAAGVGQFGSGWCWLVVQQNGTLAITKTENGVNPLCFNQTALLGCDVWEHSYYIDFRNKRPAYLENFLNNLVNWEKVTERLVSG